jgi:hypothetical protein
MLKHRSRLIGAAGAVVTVAAIAVSGAMTASAAPTGAPAAVSGTEHFQMMTTTGTGSTGSVIASGVFTAPAVDHEHSNNTSTFTFANGTILIKHSNGTGTQHFDPQTCLMTINRHGTYQLASGTGKYAGITGSGTYQLSILGIGAKSGGKCVQNKPPVAFHQVINASGPVTLP